MFLNLKPEVSLWLHEMGDSFGTPATKVAQVIIEEAMQDERKRTQLHGAKRPTGAKVMGHS